MRTVYVDSVGGLAGDMFLGAAIDAQFVSLEELRALVGAWLPERVTLDSEIVQRSWMRARTFTVKVDGPPGLHRHLPDVEALLDRCPIPAGAVARAKGWFRVLAEAESKVHGIPLGEIHFHEVGATDSLVDLACAAHVLEKLGARVEASAAIVGRGRSSMEHGNWPVPPPGTAELLMRKGVPIRAVPERFPWENAELTTPTGACLLLASERFGDLPAGRIAAVGVGAGTMDIPGFPNVTRLFLVETDERPERPERPAGATARFDTDEVVVLETWIDDLPGNILSSATEELLAAGALDVAVSTATFKKGRVGYRVEVLGPVEKADLLAALLLGRTTAIGLRVSEVKRWKLWRRETETADGLAAKTVRDATGEIHRTAPETEALVERAKAGGPAPVFGWRVDPGDPKG